ncbi:hypothetical protein LXL04_016202 [Taraxacum kok-saghyz]
MNQVCPKKTAGRVYYCGIGSSSKRNDYKLLTVWRELQKKKHFLQIIWKFGHEPALWLEVDNSRKLTYTQTPVPRHFAKLNLRFWSILVRVSSMAYNPSIQDGVYMVVLGWLNGGETISGGYQTLASFGRLGVRSQLEAMHPEKYTCQKVKWIDIKSKWLDYNFVRTRKITLTSRQTALFIVLPMRAM